MPPHLTCASALPSKTGKHENCIFASNAVLVHCLNSTMQLLDFFKLFHSRLIFVLLYDSLNLVINSFRPEGCWVHGSGERKSRTLQKLDCRVF